MKVRGPEDNCLFRRWWPAAIALVIAAAWLLIISSPFKADSSDTGLRQKLKTAGILPMADIPPPVDFVLYNIHGRPVRLSDFKGRVVLLNFWTTWCGSCRAEMPDLEALNQHFNGRDFVILAVDIQESAEQVERFFKDFHLTFKAVLDKDGTVSRTFGIRSIPTTFIIDKNGAMVGKAIGLRHWNNRAVMDVLEYWVSSAEAARTPDTTAPSEFGARS